MLSKRTLGFLEGLANASSAVYTEGGLLFTFKFGYQQAHNCSITSLRESLVTTDRQFLELTEKDIQDLGRFFQGSLGQYTKETPSQDAQEIARSLVERLHHDLQFDSASLVVEDENYGMTVQLEMVQRLNNSLYSLEIWWSVD
ncbi:hypothetical protein [Stutzerimonas stutzeri]|uniref:hypothetical protein n=1 Tax=Stutzerimonas stutzeri TaxID=316 RepID=UPI000F789FBA|nr:hypothetical protein [Stutzerimonas stutzeri]MDI9727248.1 hypothetical protein [Stutzerimonas stutzeri]MDI9749798.1 hypothetical protein [Stutzerimonas stutzeri]